MSGEIFADSTFAEVSLFCQDFRDPTRSYLHLISDYRDCPLAHIDEEDSQDDKEKGIECSMKKDRRSRL